mmetsp:Transcript_3770/g.8150  ORF Transcript_3770/g.8150 Transcript_3770/m.8150 type:complete len:460 (-) Transcript_3770:209-1588(-)
MSYVPPHRRRAGEMAVPAQAAVISPARTHPQCTSRVVSSQEVRSNSSGTQDSCVLYRGMRESSSRPQRAKGAPSRFGSIGRPVSGALRNGEDVRGGTRIDPAGMVYSLDDGSVRYFQDRQRKYPFAAGANALPLLQGLLSVNKRVFAISEARVQETGHPQETLDEGEALYCDKPTMKLYHGAQGTWSNDEYAHAGLQSIYLRLKSFQRFTESFALFERTAECGILDHLLGEPMLQPLRVASLGGGPGYELLALDWFMRYWLVTRGGTAEEKREWLTQHSFDEAHMEAHTGQRMSLASLDLQPSWEPYVLELGKRSPHSYSFAQWDVHSGVGAAQRSGLGSLDLCIISNVLVYCTDEQTADVLTDLLESGVRAILLNERGAEQRMVEMVCRRGVSVVRLMSQEAGRDDRQLVFLPSGSAAFEGLHLAQPPSDGPEPRVYNTPPLSSPTFPNVPYEENKFA